MPKDHMIMTYIMHSTPYKYSINRYPETNVPITFRIDTYLIYIIRGRSFNNQWGLGFLPCNEPFWGNVAETTFFLVTMRSKHFCQVLLPPKTLF